MRILALSYLYPNSIFPEYGIFVHNRLKAVAKYHEVIVINPISWFPFSHIFKRYRRFNNIPSQEFFDGIEVFHPRFFSVPRYFKFLDAFFYKISVIPIVENICEKSNFDIIDLHWTYPDLPTGYALKKRFKNKMIVTLRGKEAFYSTQGYIREKLIRNYLVKADAIVALSKELLEMATNKGYSGKHRKVILNGVDTSSFQYIDKIKSRKFLGLPLDKNIILTVGSLIFRKGFDRIIKALKEIIQTNPNAQLIIIGTEGPEGDWKKSLVQLINELILNKHVVFMGRIPNNELIYWYNASDLFCLASRGEGAPNVLIEALACGCPSVATDVGAAKEIITGDDMGIIVPNSLDGIRYGLKKGILQRWNREKIAQSMNNFNWDWCAKKVISLYEDLLQKAN